MGVNLNFKIVESDSENYADAVFLCEEILQKSVGKKESEEEKNNIRIAGFLDKKICTTAMLTKEDDKFFMQKIVVRQDLQGKGIGSMLLKFCEEFAMESEARVIYCCVKDSIGRSAVNFFSKNEYFCGDEDVIEDGIPHKMMWKIL
jgi:ribosomal protein S18 acetylase RimI-like enzyme